MAPPGSAAMRRRPRIAAVLAVLLLPCGLHARVFQSLGSAAQNGEALAARAGWERAYQARMEVNGADAVVQVFSVPRGQTEAIRDIRAYHEATGNSLEGRAGDILAWYVAREGGYAVRYLLQDGQTDRHTLVTRIVMSESDFNTSLQQKPTRHRLDRIAAPAGAEPLLHQKEAESETEVEISRCPGTPDAVLQELTSRLEANGWQKALPGRAPMWLFRKGGSIAMISAQPDPSGGCIVTRMVKPE
jgi:hypothetical protein